MNLDMIEAAAARMAGHVRHTPLLNAPLLDRLVGRRVFVKAECLQITGSFKARGGWSAVSALSPEARKRGVIGYSSGNHAQGVAYAAAAHGAPCVILMPSDAPGVKIANTRAYGAEVVLYDRATEDRDAIGARLSADRGLTLVKPYDDPQVIAGQGTVGLELAQQAAEAGITQAPVFVCCGGGGLSSGIALALQARATGLQVRTAEPVGFDDMARSLAVGARQRNPALSGSICDAILTPSPGELTFPILGRLAGPGAVVSDAQALQAMALAFTHLRIVLEPGGAVALAAALFGEGLPDTVIAVATGGNVDPAIFATVLERSA
ncbi:MAG: pyridoxal-phosphate dependent enzyme [Tabrizicola sp.]|uniref:threonine ammonia-lyase n=1 Tax=Tabrizicola sp. TaxID=2005166 RepID=UPI002AB97B8A|nr:pyridoxal-phosphate dependent enzyme [Tabrizicola sp.]MDZ4086323.1 pyridoxal-phosphate dependent enzyme [Tabrizicola sp.]